MNADSDSPATLGPTPKSSRRVWDLLLLLMGMGLAGYAVWILPETWTRTPWLMLAAGGVLGGLALVRVERWLPDSQPIGPPAPFPPLQRRGLGLLAGGLGLLLAGLAVGILWPGYQANWQEALLPWLAGGLLVVTAGWLLGALGQGEVQWLSPFQKQGGSHPLPLIWELLLVGLILALAVFVRIYRLDQIPPAIFVDETAGAINAIEILQGRPDSPFGTGWYETPNLFIYYMGGIFRLFGANYTSLKLVSLIPSILAVPAVYLLARALFGQMTGLLAMFLLAVNRWHMTMSRWAWNETAPPVFITLSAFFLVRGLRERRALDYALGGALGGMTLYTYLSSRLAVLTLILFALGWLLLDRDGPLAAWRRYSRGLIFFALAAAVVVAPLLVTYITDPFTFSNRSTEISVFREMEQAGNWEPLRANLWNHVQIFFQEGDPNGRHNLPLAPQTDPITGVLLAVGMGYALLRLRDRRRLLLVLWVVVNLAGGYFSESHIGSPNSYRTMTTVVAVVILAADVLARSARGVWMVGGQTGAARMAAGGVLSLALVAGVLNVQTYFGPQAAHGGVLNAFNQTETLVAKEVQAGLEQGLDVYLSPRYGNFGPVRFLVWGTEQARSGQANLGRLPFFSMQPEVDLPLPAQDTGALILVDTYYWPLIDYFLLHYPNATAELVKGPTDTPSYVRVQVSGADRAATQGLRRVLTTTDGIVTTQTVSTPEQDWTERDDVALVQWFGSLRMDHSGMVDFVLPPAFLLTVDGAAWTGPRYLSRGLHSLQAEMAFPASQSISSALVWRRADGVQEVVPPSAFLDVSGTQQGLLATYYSGESWSGPPLYQQVTPFLLLSWAHEGLLSGSFSVRFTGSLTVESPGPIRFRLDADDGVRFMVDGEVVAESLVPDRPNQVIVSLELTPGEHDIQIDYFQRGGGNALEFYWQLPGLPESPVPPSVLTPKELGQ